MASTQGKGALAFTQGIKSGFQLVDSALTSKQSRENTAQEMSERAKLRTSQLKTQAIQQTGMEQQQELDQVKLDAVEAVRLDDASKKVPNLLNSWVNGDVKDKDVRQFLTNNPQLSQKLGVKNIASVKDVNPTDTRNKDSNLYTYLTTKFGGEGQPLDPAEYTNDYGDGPELDEEAYADAVEQYATQIAPDLMTADEQILSKSALTTVTGGAKQILTDRQRKTEELLAGIYKAPVKADKISSNAEIMSYAEEAVGSEEDYTGEVPYQTAINNEFIRLKRSDKAGSGSTTEQRNVAWHEERVAKGASKDSTLADKKAAKTSKGWLAKHSTPSSILVQESKEGTAAESSDNINSYMTVGIATQDKDGNNVVVKYDPNSPTTTRDTKFEAQTRNDPTKWNTKSQARVDELEGRVTALKDTNRLVDKLSDPKVSSGLFDNMINLFNKYTPAQISTISPEQIAADVGVNVSVAKLLKEMSGLAASDNEFQRTLDSIVGNPNWDESTRRQVIEAYVKQTTEALTDDIQSQAENAL